MRIRLRPTLAAALLGLTASGGVAHATDYCVSPRATCAPANTFSAIQPALTAAQGPGFDRVLIGGGDFAVPTSGFTYSGDNVDIVGEGPDTTVLREASPSGGPAQADLSVTPSGPERSLVTGLGFVLADPTIGSIGNVAILPEAGVDVIDVKIRAPGATRPTGVNLRPGAALSGADIDFALGDGGSTGVSTFVPGTATLRRSTIRAALPVLASSGSTINVHRVRATALMTGFFALGSTINADNVIVRLDPPGLLGEAFVAQGSGGTPASVDVRHATVTGGNTGSTGLKVLSGANAAETASGGLVSSIVRVPGKSLSRHTQGAGPTPANVAANFNDYEPGAAVDIAPANGPGSAGDLNRRGDDPQFIDAASGDLRLRFDSPLIDAGNDVDLGTGPEDFAGDARVVDGNGDGTARRDMGALEYQHRPPATPAVTVAPSAGLTGDAFTWSASAADPDGDPVFVTWSWNDGVGSSGPSASRVFGSPGTYTGTAQAFDASGLSSSASADATVGARSGPGPLPTPTPDVTAPSFSVNPGKVKLTAKGTITLRMQCAAGEPEACSGRLTLTSVKKFGRKRRVLKLGSAAFGINAGRPKNIKVKVPKSAAATVRRLRKLKITATGVATDTAGNRGTARRTLTLVAARTRR